MTSIRFVAWLGTVCTANAVGAAPLVSETIGGADKQPIAVSVDFEAPDGCSERANFEAGLRARFERIQLVPAGQAAWALKVRVTPQETGVHGELRLSDAQGESELRAVEGADCTGVVEALSLTAALAIEQTVALVESTDPTRGSVSKIDEGDASRNDPNAPSLRDTSAPFKDGSAAGKTQENENSVMKPRFLRVYFGPFITQLVSPHTSFGVATGTRYTVNVSSAFRPEIGVGVSYVPVDFLQLKNDIAVDYRAVNLLACPARLRLGKVISVLPCVTTDLGRLTVSSRDVEVSTPSRRLQVFVGAEGRIDVALGERISLELGLALRLPTVNRKYVSIEPPKELGSSPSVSWLVGFGPSISF